MHVCLCIIECVCVHVFQTETTVFLHHCYGMFNRLSLSPALRRSLYSSYVWRLRQTSFAFSSSPSNGCFSLPAPTYGSSMSGTQVSPSFLQTVYLCQLTAIFTSKTWCKKKFTAAKFPQECWFLFSPSSLTFMQREESVYPLCRCGSCLCTLKPPYGSKIWRTFM